MKSTKQVDRDFRWKRVLGVSAAILLAGVSAASYLHPAAVSQKNVLRGALDQPGIQQSQAKVKESVAKLPLAFEPNMGQTDAQVKYVARAKGYTAFLTADSAVLSIKGSTPAVLRMKMQNTQPISTIEPGNRQIGKSNYVRPTGNIMGVPNYGKVTYKGIYPGIDLAYLGNERNLEYDFVVNPGADPSQIRIAYEGSSRFALDNAGNLELETAAGKALAQKPVVYQTIRGARQPIQGEYILTADNHVGFKLGAYDRSQALVIDPTLNVLAILPGTGTDEVFGVATQATGTPNGVFLTGRTASLNFLGATSGHSVAPAGNFDAFVTKLDPNGTTLVYSTFLGAAGDDAGEGIVVDALGNAYVTGYTNLAMTSTAPVAGTVGVYSAFLAKFSSAGALSLITYYGGLGTTQAFSIAMDNSTAATNGNLVIGGLTNGLPGTPSGEFKTFGGGTTDGFIATFTSALVLQASTYLGGSNYDQVNSVAVDSTGNIYAAGASASGNNINTGGNPAQYLPPNFPTGSTLGLNALGGVDNTFATNPAVAPIIGPFNIVGGTQTAFATKYNSALTQRRFSSIFGPGGETASGIAVDPAGVVYVVGSTRSPFFYPNVPNPSGATVYAQSGSLPNVGALRFGAPITSAVAPNGLIAQANPTQSQGFLVTLQPANSLGANQGLLNYVALQGGGAAGPANVLDPNVTGTCNLMLTRFGGALGGVPSPCTGVAGTFVTGGWNGVTVDADAQAYIAGQTVVAGPFNAAQIVRARNYTLSGTPQWSTFDGSTVASSQAFGIVTTAYRLAFFVGEVTAPTATTIAQIQGATSNLSAPTQPGVKSAATGNPILAGSAAKADASTDGLYGAVQYNDIFATPTTVTLPAVGLLTPTTPNGPIGTFQMANTLNIQNTCVGGSINGTLLSSTGGSVTVGPFVVTQLANTSSFQVLLASGATNVAGPLGPSTAYINCGGENISAVTITGSVFGPITWTPAATLVSSSAYTTGVLTPYTTLVDSTAGNINNGTFFENTFINANGTVGIANNNGIIRIPISVVTPAANNTGTQPYTVNIQGQTASTGAFPSASCGTNGLGLVGVQSNASGTQWAASTGTSGSVGGTAQPAGFVTPTLSNGGLFTVNINAFCANQLPVGTYSANIVITNTLGGTQPASIPFSLTITGGGAVSQQPLSLGFLSNTSAAQQTSFSVTAQGSAPLTYGINYIPANPPQTPLPATAFTLISGGAGTIPAGGTNSVILSVSPAGLAAGVYFGSFQVTVPGTNPLQVYGQPVGISVYVGAGVTSLVSVVPANNTVLNIPVPASYTAANLTQPNQIQVSAVGDTSVTPVYVGNTTGISGITAPTISTPTNFPSGVTACFLPPGGAVTPATAQPACALRLTPNQGSNNNPNGTCTVFAPSPLNSGAASCYYSLSVDTTLLPVGAYASTITLTATNGLVLNIPVALNVQQLPSISVKQNVNGVGIIPLTGLNFSGVAGVDLTTCQTIYIQSTGGVVPGVVATTNNSYLALLANQPANNTQFVPGYFNSYTFGTVTGGSNYPMTVCANAVGQPARPAVLNGQIAFSASGIGAPILLPVTFTLSGGTGSSANLSQLGVFRAPPTSTPGLGQFYLDTSIVGNNQYNYDNGDKGPRWFGLSGDKPVAGDWFGTGVVSVGVFRCPIFPAVGVCAWYIDQNNNGTWDGTAGGDAIWYFGLPGDQPIVGDWNGDGKSKIGVMRCPASGVCTWYLDAGNQHGLAYSGVLTPQFGLTGDVPVANNWGGNGPVDQIGVFRCPPASAPGVCTWFVDSNGDFNPIAETQYSYGVTGDIPIVGNWFNTGRKRIGVWRNGQVILNQTGTNTFVYGIDFGSTGGANFGLPGDLPVIGFWTMP